MNIREDRDDEFIGCSVDTDRLYLDLDNRSFSGGDRRLINHAMTEMNPMTKAIYTTVLLALPLWACTLEEGVEAAEDAAATEIELRKPAPDNCNIEDPNCEYCGDLICQNGEEELCPYDCRVCGDTQCTIGENTLSCPEDCGTACGDGVCNGAESIDTCFADCGPKFGTVRLDRVIRCRNGFPLPCNSTLTEQQYHWWEYYGVANGKQKRTFISRASEPDRSAVRRLVFLAAGQQNDGLDPDLPSQLTGQFDEYKDAFSAKTGSASVGLAAGSLARRLVEDLHVNPDDTFIGLAFDARFNYDFSSSNKQEIENAYYAWLRDRFEAQNLESIYLAGHSRGGCLAMRLARRFNADFPAVPMVVQVFDPVCHHKDGEMGVWSGSVDNPVSDDSELFARPVNMEALFTDTSNLRVLNIVSGALVVDIPFDIGSGIRAFAHETSDGSSVQKLGDWYEQRWSEIGHHWLGNSDAVVNRALTHLQAACQQIGC